MSLETLSALWDVKGVHHVSLQKEMTQDEAIRLSGAGVLNLGAEDILADALGEIALVERSVDARQEEGFARRDRERTNVTTGHRSWRACIALGGRGSFGQTKSPNP